MTEIIGRRRKPAPWHVATTHGVPLFVGPGILLPMGISAAPKLFEGIAVALFTAPMFLVAALAHEAAHAVAARRRGFSVRLVSIGSGSFCWCGDVTAQQVGVFVYAAGALTNLAPSAGRWPGPSVATASICCDGRAEGATPLDRSAQAADRPPGAGVVDPASAANVRRDREIQRLKARSHRPANHGTSRRIASSTSGVETAKEKRMKRWPSTGSKSMPGAVATPVSSRSWRQKP